MNMKQWDAPHRVSHCYSPSRPSPSACARHRPSCKPATNSSGREGRDYFWCKKVQEEKVLLAPTAPNRHSIQTSNRHKNNHVSTRNRSCIDVKSIGTISPSFLLLVSFFPLLAGAFPAVVSPEPEVGVGLDAALQEAGVEVGELEVGDGDGGIGKEA